MARFIRKYLGWIVLVVAVLAFGGYWYGSPYSAVNSIRLAVKNHDAENLNKFIDFPAVRESLKVQLTNEVNLKLDEKSSKNPLAALGQVFSASIVNSLVDQLVTPKGMVELLEGGKKLEAITDKPEQTAQGKADQGANQAPSTTQNFAYTEEPSSKLEWSSKYGANMDQFNVTLSRSQDPGKKLIVTLVRQGFFSWKVNNLLLPLQ